MRKGRDGFDVQGTVPRTCHVLPANWKRYAVPDPDRFRIGVIDTVLYYGPETYLKARTPLYSVADN